MNTQQSNDKPRCACKRCPMRYTTLALLFLAAVVFNDALYTLAVRLLGPPAVAMTETHTDPPTTQPAATFAHTPLNNILAQHVDSAGYVDYAALAADTAALDAYITSLATAPFDRLSRDGKLALLINAYNAFTLKLITDFYDDGKLTSIKDIPKEKRWDHARWTLAGKTHSLNQIEHELVRPNFKEPRIHFALVCAAVSCPPLRPEAYTADQLEEQLVDQSKTVHTQPRWFSYDPRSNTVKLTALYQWYAGDFEQTAGSVSAYVASQSPTYHSVINSGRTPAIEYLNYSWLLNDQAALEN